jgi:hypothetical protein
VAELGVKSFMHENHYPKIGHRVQAVNLVMFGHIPRVGFVAIVGSNGLNIQGGEKMQVGDIIYLRLTGEKVQILSDRRPYKNINLGGVDFIVRRSDMTTLSVQSVELREKPEEE